MSRQSAHSPRYRTFPWEEPDFDPEKVVAQLDGMPLGWGESDGPREPWRERRHQHYQPVERRSAESHSRRRNSPFSEPQYFDADEGPRHREAFRENKGRYEDRRGDDPPDRNHAQRESGWRQDQSDRGSRERFRDRSPQRRDNNRNNRQRGRGRGQYKPNIIHRDKWTPNQDNQQHMNRNRREMDGSPRSGYEREEQRFSADDRREGFYRNEHEFIQNRNEPMEPLRRDRYSPKRDTDHQRSRSMSREDMRGGHFEESYNNDGYREERRSPFDDRPSQNQYRGRPANRGGTRGNYNRRGRFFRRGRGWARGNRSQSQRAQNPPNEPPRFREEDEFLDEPESGWEQRGVDQAWEDDEDRDREFSPQPDLEMQHPQEQWGRNKPKTDMMVITEETLTIKVDMSRPVNKNSLMLYSADRPLSLDLVHVGRQRLDFLTSAENPGPNRENSVHTGTFAQEIITLVHQVKDQYFGGQGVALTERFSALQSSEFVNEEPQGMTLNKRFSSNRGLNVNNNSLPDREEQLFSKQGPLQLLGSPSLRDPDDLRHDLEKRRQERLEGVKVTITGQSQQQRPPGEQKYGDEEEFSNWSEEPHWRKDGQTGPEREGSFRPFRGNNRQMRRPNFRNNSRGQNW